VESDGDVISSDADSVVSTHPSSLAIYRRFDPVLTGRVVLDEEEGEVEGDAGGGVDRVQLAETVAIRGVDIGEVRGRQIASAGRIVDRATHVNYVII